MKDTKQLKSYCQLHILGPNLDFSFPFEHMKMGRYRDSQGRGTSGDHVVPRKPPRRCVGG